MKSRLAFFLLLMIGFWSALPGADAQENSCPVIVTSALQTAHDACQNTGRNQICYGNIQLQVEPQSGIEDLVFNQRGDIADVSAIHTLALSSMNEETGEWGIALMHIQANLPDSLPGQNVSFLMFGNVSIENDVPLVAEIPQLDITAASNINIRSGPSTQHGVVGGLDAGDHISANGRLADNSWLRIALEDGSAGWVFSSLISSEGDINSLDVVDPAAATPVQPAMRPMQAFYFHSGIGDAPCEEAPDSGLLIQTPHGVGEISLQVNGVDITLSSTVYLQAQSSGELVVNAIEDEARIQAAGGTETAVAGTRVRVPLDANLSPAGPPDPPEPYNGQSLQALPLQYLDRSTSLIPALTREEIDARLATIPIVEESLSDTAGDVFACDTRAGVQDVEVDIVRVTAGRAPDGSLQVKVYLQEPLVNDYSFAVVLNLVHPQGRLRYIWEIHDEVYRISELDPATGNLITDSQASIEQDGNMVIFFIPAAEVPEGINQIGALSFHTPSREMQPQPAHCDFIGLVDFPAALR